MFVPNYLHFKCLLPVSLHHGYQICSCGNALCMAVVACMCAVGTTGQGMWGQWGRIHYYSALHLLVLLTADVAPHFVHVMRLLIQNNTVHAKDITPLLCMFLAKQRQ